MKYTYTRELINELYNIDNIERKDANLNNINLAFEIQTQFSNKYFKVICDAVICEIDFLIELTSEEKTILDTIVSNHKQNLL